MLEANSAGVISGIARLTDICRIVLSRSGPASTVLARFTTFHPVGNASVKPILPL